MTFPENLMRLRKVRGWSQGDLAKATKLQPSAISHFERGRRSPNMDNLNRLATALGVKIEELTGTSTTTNNRLLAAFAQMSEHDRECLVEFAELLARKNTSPLTKLLTPRKPCHCEDGYMTYYPGGHGPCRECNRGAYDCWVEEGRP